MDFAWWLWWLTAGAVSTVALFLILVFGEYLSRKLSSTFVLTVALLNYVVLPLSKLAHRCGQLLRAAWSAVKKFVRAAWTAIKNFFRNLWKNLIDLADYLWRKLGEFLRWVERAVRRVLDAILDPFKRLVRWIVAQIKRAARAIRDLLRRVFDWVWEWIVYWIDFKTLWLSARSVAALFFRFFIIFDDLARGLAKHRYAQIVVVRGRDQIITISSAYRFIPTCVYYYLLAVSAGVIISYNFQFKWIDGAAVSLILPLVILYVYQWFRSPTPPAPAEPQTAQSSEDEPAGMSPVRFYLLIFGMLGFIVIVGLLVTPPIILLFRPYMEEMQKLADAVDGVISTLQNMKVK